jgi:hypothetical protein
VIDALAGRGGISASLHKRDEFEVRNDDTADAADTIPIRAWAIAGPLSVLLPPPRSAGNQGTLRYSNI